MKENGFEYVDLGFPSGTMWATCNVGAETPEDWGLLFQFGRVDGYEYGDNNNQFRTNKQNKQDTGSKDIPLTTSGKVYNTGDILDLEDDAAYINMGGKWRMPTKDELEELTNYTTYEVETINGVKGMMFTSKINRNKLFIPFAGWWYNNSFLWAGSCGYMWSSQVYDYNINGAYRFFCSCSTNVDDFGRSSVYSVRGVFKK